MNTKKNTRLIAVLLFMAVISIQDLSAQDIELNGFAGWQFGGKARLYEGDFDISDAMNYGGKLAVGLSSTTFVEISYMRADTDGRFYSYNGGSSDVFEFSSNYIHIAGLQEADLGRISPYGTLGVGLVFWTSKSSQLEGKTQFSITLGAGVKIWLTDIVGIRIHGGMMMPMVWNGAGFGCGIGTGGAGCGGAVYTRITPFQGEFSGGLVFRLPRN